MRSKAKPKGGSPSALQDFFMRMGVLGELLALPMGNGKLYWMLPMVITLLVFALLIVLGGSSPISPFIYTLF